MNTWPKWLPYPISWIRAFGLCYALTALVKSQFPLQHSDGVAAVLIGAWTTVPFLFTFFHWAIASVAKFLLKHLPAHPKLAPVRQYLTDRWSGSERSHWREGLNAFIISFVAFIVSFLVVSYLTPVPSRADADYARGFYVLRRNVLRLRLDIISIGMFFVSAYLYQYDLWARHRRTVKSAAKAKAQEPTKRRSPKNLPAPDPVEQELNQLKAQSGMSRMKTVRPAVSTPEAAEWYVFRSGSAEGPYTRMQLLEVQKITDRTKVRRGETDWQRAGEISELAAYLTEK
ncbi:DUF4339 domain-containing protein [Microcoleus sp. herbarium12]|uniref:DUF4339 domain-containing protein n=1 Tax=Microcoleus sp. herbarium12 TaxID=3055437 RepID=UPI002FCEAF70